MDDILELVLLSVGPSSVIFEGRKPFVFSFFSPYFFNFFFFFFFLFLLSLNDDEMITF